jgi:hypothetical protein
MTKGSLTASGIIDELSEETPKDKEARRIHAASADLGRYIKIYLPA